MDLIKPPRGRHVRDIVKLAEVARLVKSIWRVSYRVLFSTLLDSMGRCLGDGLRLTVADIHAERRRVHIRDAKQATLAKVLASRGMKQITPYNHARHLRPAGLSGSLVSAP
jgi:hypothetical protein